MIWRRILGLMIVIRSSRIRNICATIKISHVYEITSCTEGCRVKSAPRPVDCGGLSLSFQDFLPHIEHIVITL